MLEMRHQVDKFFPVRENVYPFCFIKNFKIYKDFDQMSNDFL